MKENQKRVKKVIHITDRKDFLKCDETDCEFTMPFPATKGDDLKYDDYINAPCPSCGSNLLTVDDLKRFKLTMSVIDFINKWFWFLGTYPSDNDNIVTFDVETHKEITITPIEKE